MPALFHPTEGSQEAYRGQLIRAGDRAGPSFGERRLSRGELRTCLKRLARFESKSRAEPGGRTDGWMDGSC